MSRPLLVFEVDGVLLDAGGGWIANPGVLEALGESFQLAVVNGREEVQRFAPGVFTPAESLQQAVESNAGDELYYAGDSVNQATAARVAGVRFIGIAGPNNAQYLDLVFAFQELGAYAIVDDINFLHEVFAS